MYPSFSHPTFPPQYYGLGSNPVVGTTGITSFGVGTHMPGTDNLQNLAIPVAGVPGPIS